MSILEKLFFIISGFGMFVLFTFFAASLLNGEYSLAFVFMAALASLVFGIYQFKNSKGERP